MENCGFKHEFRRVVGSLRRCAVCGKVIYREEKSDEQNLRNMPEAKGCVLPKSAEAAKRQRQKSKNLSRRLSAHALPSMFSLAVGKRETVVSEEEKPTTDK